jgi:TadE-like protein
VSGSALGTLGRAQNGATLVEFALVAPVFLALLFGTLEFGRALWTQQALQETAIAGARCMALPQTSCATSTGTPPTYSYSSTMTTSYIQQVANQWGVSLPSANITQNNVAKLRRYGRLLSGLAHVYVPERRAEARPDTRHRNTPSRDRLLSQQSLATHWLGSIGPDMQRTPKKYNRASKDDTQLATVEGDHPVANPPSPFRLYLEKSYNRQGRRSSLPSWERQWKIRRRLSGRHRASPALI